MAPSVHFYKTAVVAGLVCAAFVSTATCGVNVGVEQSGAFRGTAAATSASDDVPPYDTKWFSVRVDHFNPQMTQVYKMRYLVNEQFFGGKDGDPIFFYTGNEGNIEDFWKATGFVFDIAPQFRPLIVFAEHRYYGESLPFGKDSWSRENIGYLTIEQALADYAVLIDALRAEYAIPHSPTVVLGGSYGGMLSAWFRIKYPNIVDAALAASAPILYTTTGSNDPRRFFEIVTNDFAKADARCPDLVRAAYTAIDAASTSAAGQRRIQESFGLCKAPATADDFEQLRLWSANAFTTMAMGDYPYPTGFLGALPAWPVTVACKQLLGAPADDPMAGLGAAMNVVYNATAVACHDIYEEFVFCADQTGCGTTLGGKSWDYQACTEINMPMVTNNVTDMFPPRKWTEHDLAAYCMKTWGTVPEPDWVRIHLEGKDISASSRIIFSNGLLDPWHGGGFLETLSDSLVALTIDLGAHHLDLRASNPLDPQCVIDVRKKEVEYLHQWTAAARAERFAASA